MTITKASVVTKTAVRTSPLPDANKITEDDVNELKRVTDDLVDAVNGFEGDIVFVSAKTDLPDAVAGVITLADNTTYWFATTVDLTGDRLVAGTNTVILGSSSENCKILSTGLTGTALLTSTKSLPMRHVTLEADIALNLQGDGTTALDWYGVNFLNCNTVGTIANHSNVIIVSSAFLSSGDLTIDGTIGTVGFDNCLFVVPAGKTGVIIPATATFTRRFRVVYSAVVAGDPTATGINFSASATVPVEGFILDTVAFSGGGTYVAGVGFGDDKSAWTNCSGVTNSATIGNLLIQNNATVSAIGATNTPVAVAGTTTVAALNQRFDHDAVNGALEYVATTTRLCRVQLSATILAPNNNVIGVYIAVDRDGLPFDPPNDVISESEVYITTNGARPDSVFIQAFVDLNEGDKVYAAVENRTATNDVTVQFMNLIVERASL